jgi:hypothetical protein
MLKNFGENSIYRQGIPIKEKFYNINTNPVKSVSSLYEKYFEEEAENEVQLG